MKKALLLAVIAILATASVYAASTGPGLGGSLSKAGLVDAKNIITPLLFKYITNMTLPD